jgi:purine nucleosidase
MTDIILDTDIGTDVDDALALAFALRNPKCRVLGVTTVHLDALLRARIARKLLRLMGREDVPVARGADHPLGPLAGDSPTQPALMGHEGRGILDAEDRDLDPIRLGATDFLVDLVSRNKGRVALVAIGPLTNIASALRKEPRIAQWSAGLTVMGGAVYPDAVPAPWWPEAEYNLNCDPVAAREVLASGIPVTLVGLDVTLRVFLDAAERNIIASRDPVAGPILADMMEIFLDQTSKHVTAGRFPDLWSGRVFLHDPLALHVALGGTGVRLEPMHLEMENVKTGLRTVRRPGLPANCRAAVEVESGAFRRHFLDVLAAPGR